MACRIEQSERMFLRGVDSLAAGQEEALTGISGMVPHLATMLGSEGRAALKGEGLGQTSSTHPPEVQLEVVHALLLLLPFPSEVRHSRCPVIAAFGAHNCCQHRGSFQKS